MVLILIEIWLNPKIDLYWTIKIWLNESKRVLQVRILTRRLDCNISKFRNYNSELKIQNVKLNNENPKTKI